MTAYLVAKIVRGTRMRTVVDVDVYSNSGEHMTVQDKEACYATLLTCEGEDFSQAEQGIVDICRLVPNLRWVLPYLGRA